MITIYSGGKAIQLPVSSESYHEAKVGAVATLVVETTSDKSFTFPLGMHCTWQGEKYYLYTPAEVVKVSTREYRYTLTFHGEGQQLALSKFKFIVDKPTDVRLSFALTGTPRFYLEQILRSLPSGFSIGACLEAEAQAISFKHEDCLSALSRIAEAFKTEWLITGKTIHLGKVVGDKTKSLTLSYGQGNGLLSGLTASSDNDKSPVGKLFVQGTERNIDPSKYGAKSLHLPKERTMSYEGRTYVVSADGQSLSVSGLSTDGRKEDSFDGTNIYPQRVGVVSSVVVTPNGNYDIVDKDNNVDYSQYRIAGEKATITFQTGRLAGRTFDIAQDKDVLKYDHTARRFQLVSIEEDGVKLPEPKTFYPAVGDKYAVFGVRLPDEYITKAETELLNASVRYFHESLLPKVTYKAELDGIYAQKNWGEVGTKLKVGAYVRLVDANLSVDDYVRITAVRTKLSEPYKPQITLSNEIQAPSLSSSLGTLEAEGVQRKEDVKAVRREVARTYQQALSLTDNIAEEVSNRFAESISPLTARTMQLMVGDKALQFTFVVSPSSPDRADHSITWDESRGVLHADGGYLRHMTLGIATITTEHTPSEYKTWMLPAYDYAVRSDQKTIHLYAKVERNGANGVFVASDTAKGMEDESGYYYLYIGVLSPAPNRAFTTLYGYSEVLPGQIRTDRIATPDGGTYIDLVNGEISSPRITFIHPDGAKKPYPADYLHQAIHEGTTDIQGGLVLASVIGAKDSNGQVRSYLAGQTSLPAFSAGVTGFGTPEAKAVTELKHDGTGHIGAMHIERGGEIVTFRKEGEYLPTLRIGGAQTNLDSLLQAREQNDKSSIYIPAQSFTLKNGSTSKTVVIFSTAIRSLHSGASLEINLPWHVAFQAIGENRTVVGVTNTYAIITLTGTGGEEVYSKRISVDNYIENTEGFNAQRRVWSSFLASFHEVVYDVPEGILTLTATLEAQYYYHDGRAEDASLDVRISRGEGSYLIHGENSALREAVFGENGLSFFYGKKRLMYVNSQEGQTFLTVKGATDLPGVLLGGRVNPGSVTFDHIWGVKASIARVERIGGGTYRITHNFGHSRYSVICTEQGNGRHNANWGNVTDNSFEIYTYYDNTKYNDIPFSFIVVGDNY